MQRAPSTVLPCRCNVNKYRTWDFHHHRSPFFPPPSGMSGKPSRGHTKRISSRISRFKNRVSSVFSPSSQGSRLADDDTGRLGIPTHHAEDRLPSASTSHRQSISNISLDSNVNHIPAHPSASPLPFSRHLKESASQNHSSTHLAPPSPLQPPQEQVLTSPNTSVSGMFKFETPPHHVHSRIHNT